MTYKKDIELLAPAGSIIGLKAVIAAGADAVYIGGSRFGARAYADNPGEDDLIEAIDYAHLRGVKVYMTVNTLLKDSELDSLHAYLLPYYLRGVDGVLVQDFGVLRYLHRCFPDLPLHASTQMTVTGPESAKFLKKYGVTRVVPAREMSLDELYMIARESGLEVEAFVHGALCVCMSGMCLASSLIGGRSGNRGRCAQPCRLLYEAEGTCAELLSPKDLCTLDLLPDLIEHGVVSLKIEGRMKQPEYAAGVVCIYRKYLDLYRKGGRQSYRVNKSDREMLLTLFNRDGFTDGYLKRHNGKDMMAFKRRTLNLKEEQIRSALYDRIHETYVAHEKLLPLSGTIYVTNGQPITMTLETCDDERIPKVSVTEQGENVLAAFSRPLSSERIASQLTKTGGTDFTIRNLDVLSDETSFVPMGALNAFRRQALSHIRSEILAPSVRTAPNTDPCDNGGTSQGSICRNAEVPEQSAGTSSLYNFETPGITVSIETAEQFDAAVSAVFIDRIYISEVLLAGENDLTSLANKYSNAALKSGYSGSERKGSPDYMARAALMIEICKEKKILPFIMLPYIERQGYMPIAYTYIEELFSRGAAGLIARSFETAAHLANLGYADRTILDAGVYTWNRESILWASENGFRQITAPFELNKKELRKRNNRISEIIVYGRIPLMVTAQCLRKNLTGCRRRSELLSLRDRTKREFPVKCECVFCYNTVYNSEVLSLIRELDYLASLGFMRTRISLTTESHAEAENVLHAFERAHTYGTSENLTIPYTKGHFNRGVE